jgi:hypothetical protein
MLVRKSFFRRFPGRWPEVSYNFACWGWENLFSYTGFAVSSAHNHIPLINPRPAGHVALPELTIGNKLRDVFQLPDQKREICAPGPRFKAVVTAAVI